jgi:hypothetical protein
VFIKEDYFKGFGKIVIDNWLRIYFLLKTKVSRERLVVIYFPQRITIEQEDNISVTPAFSETKLTIHSQVISLDF